MKNFRVLYRAYYADGSQYEDSILVTAATEDDAKVVAQNELDEKSGHEMRCEVTGVSDGEN